MLTQGATQSNHARQTAAAAAKLGMDCHILLEDRTGYNEPNYLSYLFKKREGLTPKEFRLQKKHQPGKARAV